MGELSPQPLERLLFQSLLIAANEISDVFTDVFLGSILSYVHSDDLGCRAITIRRFR